MYQVQVFDPFSRLWTRRGRNTQNYETALARLAQHRNGQIVRVEAPSRPLALLDRGQLFDLRGIAPPVNAKPATRRSTGR